MNFVFKNYLRGILTGRFKREEIPDASSSRVGYMFSQKAFGQLGAWATYSDDDQYWKIIDQLKQISMDHGISSRCVFFLFCDTVSQKKRLFRTKNNIYIYSCFVKVTETQFIIQCALWCINHEDMFSNKKVTMVFCNGIRYYGTPCI